MVRTVGVIVNKTRGNVSIVPGGRSQLGYVYLAMSLLCSFLREEHYLQFVEIDARNVHESFARDKCTRFFYGEIHMALHPFRLLSSAKQFQGTILSWRNANLSTFIGSTSVDQGHFFGLAKMMLRRPLEIAIRVLGKMQFAQHPFRVLEDDRDDVFLDERKARVWTVGCTRDAMRLTEEFFVIMTVFTRNGIDDQ